jgi:hypothetical protein
MPRGFAEMVIMDETGLDRAHYTFQFVRREFLGDIRCVAYDVTPQKDSGSGRFLGRIWVEDQDYNIVRFNDSLRAELSPYFDSWRVNCGPNLWLPAYVYTEESAMLGLGTGRRQAMMGL